MKFFNCVTLAILFICTTELSARSCGEMYGYVYDSLNIQPVLENGVLVKEIGNFHCEERTESMHLRDKFYCEMTMREADSLPRPDYIRAYSTTNLRFFRCDTSTWISYVSYKKSWQDTFLPKIL